MSRAQKKENETYPCQGCREDFRDNKGGLTCPSGHFLCKAGSCAEQFLKSTLLGDDNILAAVLVDRDPGHFNIKCGVCKSPFDSILLDKVVHDVGDSATVEAYSNWMAICSLSPEESTENCQACGQWVVLDKSNNYIIFSCVNPDCKKLICRFCRKEVNQWNVSQHVEEKENCWQLLDYKFKIDEAMEKGYNCSCPQCGRVGRKDDNCTHIRCQGCHVQWCYLCGLEESACDKPSGTSFMGHQEDWRSNSRRCPLYLQELRYVDRRFQDDATQAMNEFHRQRTLRFLQKVCKAIPPSTMELMIEKFPAILNGFTQHEINNFNLSQCLRRGKWYK